MNEPRRRDRRNTDLDASVATVKRALLVRAHEAERLSCEPHRVDYEATALATVAGEFRALAEELHWWD